MFMYALHVDIDIFSFPFQFRGKFLCFGHDDNMFYLT